MYARQNFKTKKALKDAVKAGPKASDLTVFAPGLGTPARDGIEFLEGPHGGAHTWYAQVMMKDGVIVKVMK